jgi:hypothetical protein
VKYFLGLDLGQSHEFTALCILEQRFVPQAEQPGYTTAHYDLVHLERWPLQTPYLEIVRHVAELVVKPPLAYPTLVVDQTAVGKAVVDLFRSVNLRANLQPVVITGGHEIGGGDGNYLVPKTELVSTVQLLLQGRRLRIAPTLKEARTLAKELQTFKTQKVTLTAGETFEAWREREHDDLVLAVALAAWMAEPLPWQNFTSLQPIEEPRLPERVGGSSGWERIFNRFRRGSW